MEAGFEDKIRSKTWGKWMKCSYVQHDANKSGFQKLRESFLIVSEIIYEWTGVLFSRGWRIIPTKETKLVAWTQSDNPKHRTHCAKFNSLLCDI